ncbi:MAG: bifunctional folylpolyglutamate synthase/dihydrofolate synthase [Candidatus Rokuibacteriota bacterium]
MTYTDAVSRVLALRGGEHAGMRPGLDRIHALLAALGHPERRYHLVQVGGTNGKGSVSAMLAAMLKAAGRRTGLYTSPHLVSFRERIRVNGDPISEDSVADGVEALATLAARLDTSMFEATTALAFDHFAREEVEVAVLEVGLGGRLDATTVGTPLVTILTQVDLDHQAVLGPTLADIAREKAAIVRGGLALSAAQAPEVAAVVEDHAVRAGVPLLFAGRELHVQVNHAHLDGQRICCEGPGWALPDLDLALLGTFQPGNALLAVAAARHLNLPEAAIRAGLTRVQWPGRFQVIGVRPRLVLDGAHNVAGARALAASLRSYFSGQSTTLIVGLSADKDVAGILAELAPLADHLIATAASNPRAVAPTALVAGLPAHRPHADTAPSVVAALALAAQRPTSVTVVTGSLYLVADALEHLFGDRPLRVERAAR